MKLYLRWISASLNYSAIIVLAVVCSPSVVAQTLPSPANMALHDVETLLNISQRPTMTEALRVEAYLDAEALIRLIVSQKPFQLIDRTFPLSSGPDKGMTGPRFYALLSTIVCTTGYNAPSISTTLHNCPNPGGRDVEVPINITDRVTLGMERKASAGTAHEKGDIQGAISFGLIAIAQLQTASETVRNNSKLWDALFDEAVGLGRAYQDAGYPWERTFWRLKAENVYLPKSSVTEANGKRAIRLIFDK